VRLRWLIALVGALSVLWPSAVSAEAIEVLRVGWDGTVVPTAWSPVKVRATGGDRDVTARVEVELRGRWQPGPQATPVSYPLGAYGQELALPAGVAKELTIWVPAEGNTSGRVVLSADGRELAAQPIDFRSARSPFWPLVGVLAESPGVARAIGQVELPFEGLPIPLSVARLGAADLPPQPERLAALSALVVQGNAAAGLTNEQRRAVAAWVEDGGHLLLLGGPDGPRTAAALPSGYLPAALGADPSPRPAPPASGHPAPGEGMALARWAGVSAAPSAVPVARIEGGGGSALVGPPDRPLAWRQTRGRGTVTLLAVDPSLEPLVGWSGTPALLKKALEPALPSGAQDEKTRAAVAYGKSAGQRLGDAVNSLPPEAFPTNRTAGLILVGFALAVGPGLHLLLWRSGRRGWVWLAVPGAALVVAAGLYVLGIGREGRDVIGNVVAHVRLAPDGGPAQQELAAGFYAPTHPRLTVTVPGEAPVRVVSRAMPSVFGPNGLPPSVGDEPPFHVVAGRDTRVELSSGEWSMRTLTFERSVAEDLGRVGSQLGIEGGLIRGMIRNDTPYPLEDAAVLVGGGLAKVGSLAPGQSAPVVLDPATSQGMPTGGPGLSWRLFARPIGEGGAGTAPTPAPVRPVRPVPAGVSYAPGPMPGPVTPMELPRDPETQRRARLVDAVMNVPRPFGPTGESLPLTFVGFTRAPIGGGHPTAGDHPLYHLTLIEQPLRLDLGHGPFVLPEALAPGEIVGAPNAGMGGGGNGVLFWQELYGGSVVYAFRPPLPEGASVTALVVTTRQIGASQPAEQVRRGPAPPPPNVAAGPSEPGVFALFNARSGAWEPLPAGEQARVQPGDPYLGPDGTVRLQVTAPSDRMVRFVPPSLSVEGVAP
jgi:hypothetical protein